MSKKTFPLRLMPFGHAWRRLRRTVAVPAHRLLLAALLGGVARPAPAEVQTATGAPAPTRLRSHLLALPADWAAKLPPTGQVNSPACLATLHPGQHLALALMAEGADRDALLEGMHGTVRIKVKPAGTEQSLELKPGQIRRIKAEGADFALLALTAAGISGADRAKMEAATSLVSLAVLTPGWTVPATGQPAEVEIRLELSGSTAPVAIEPLILPIKTAAAWLQEPAPGPEALKMINRHRGDLAPGQLLALFQLAARTKNLRAVPVHGYFALAFQADPLARAAAIHAYPTLDAESQGALLWVFRLGGLDLRKNLPDLPAETFARYDPIVALPDPRRLPVFTDPVDVPAVKQLGNLMDLGWAGWMATGDRSYLRALVGLLENPDDFPALQSWQQTRGGEQGLNARVAKGLGYQIAGWSIGSFQRTDPLVADWLRYWQDDPEISATIRQEIATLATNPAFRRK